MSAEGIGQRLEELMKADGKKKPNVSAFARKCEIPESLMRKYLKGSVPSADRAAQIAHRNGVTLQWLVTGEGPRAFEDASQANTSTAAQSINAELMGRVVDRIARIYREERVILPDVDLGRIAAERYAEILDFSNDPDEWPSFLDVIASRVRKAIRAARTDPANAKHRASGS